MIDDERRPSLSPRTLAVFLDVDGTLLGFKNDPGEVVADPELRDLLIRLRVATAGALALNSGRTIADLDRIMSPIVLPAAGTHGAELRLANGQTERTGSSALDMVRDELRAFVDAHPGAMLEDKGAAVGMHYRHAPGIARALSLFLDELLPRHGLAVQHGKMVADVKSPASSKGGAIKALMATPPFAGRSPLFVGDDLTDETGFETVNAMGGVSIKVGEGETCAGKRLAGVAEVRAYLAALSQA